MRREGSPLTGVSAVLSKELADHLSSVRMRVLEILVLICCTVPVVMLVSKIRTLPIGEDRFLLLYLFSLTTDSMFPLYTMLSLILPIFAIGLGFDSVNSEFSRRTMSRILAQPVYRDAVLLGKFLAGVATLAITLFIIWLLVVGGGILALGVAPTIEELGRSLVFIVCALAYASLWLAVAMFFSTVFQSAATSVLCALGLWLFFQLGWPMIVPYIVERMFPMSRIAEFQSMIELALEQSDTLQLLSRFSPATLYSEAAYGILSPSTRSLQDSTNFLQQIPALRGRAIVGAPLKFIDSVLLIWPQLVSMIAVSILLFAVTYITFQRQEVRA